MGKYSVRDIRHAIQHSKKDGCSGFWFADYPGKNENGTLDWAMQYVAGEMVLDSVTAHMI